MRLARVVRYSFLGILALLAIVIVLLLTVDLGRLKGTTENLLSNLFGREFTINGEFRVELGRHIYVVAADVRLANADWSANEDFASIGRLEGTIDAWSLFSFPLLIESLRIENTRVDLERTNSGDNNWTLFPPQEPDAADGARAKDRPRLPVMLVDASVTDFELTYNSPQRPRQFLFATDEFRLAQTDSKELQLRVHGNINETPLELTASAGTVDNLADYSDIEFDVSGHLGEIRFDGEASVDDLLRPRRPTAELQLRGPNAEYLTDILRVPQVTTGPLDLTATIVPVGDKMQLLLTGVFGEFSLDVTGRFVDLQDLQNVDLRVSASGPDAGTVAGLFGNDSVPDDPFSVVGNLQRSGGMIAVDGVKVTVGNSQFDVAGRFDNFPDPRSARVTIRVDGPDFGRFNKLLGLPGRLAGPFTLAGDLLPLTAGGASVDLTATAQDVQVSVIGEVTDDPDFLGTRVEVTIAGPDLQTITAAGGLENAPAEPFELMLVVERVAKGAAIEAGTLSIADDHLTFEGLVGNKPLQADTDVQFELAGPDFAQILAAFGRDANKLPTAKYTVTGRIERGAEFFVLHDVTAAIGDELEYRLTANGRLGASPGLDGTKLTVKISGADLSRLLPDENRFSALNKSFELSTILALRDQELSLGDIEVRVAEARLTGEADLGLSPLLGSGRFSFDATAPDLFLLVPRLAEDSVVEQAPLELHAAGNWADALWTLDNFLLRLGKGNLAASGTFDGPPKFDRTDLLIDLNIASIRNFSVLAGRELPDDAAHMKFHLVGSGNTMSLDEFTGTFGDSDITGDFSLRGGDVREIHVGFRSNRLNLAPYLPDSAEVAEPENKTPASTPKRDRVIPDTAIPVEALRNYDASVDIEVTELILPRRTWNGIVLEGTVKDGALSVTQFNLRSSLDETITGDFELRPIDSGAELLLATQGTGLKVGLPAQSEKEFLALPKYDVDTVLHGSGATLREIAGSLNGYVRIVAGPGRVKPTALKFLAGDILSQVLEAVNPFAKTDPYTNFECGALLLRIDDGVITGKPGLLTQSDRLRMFVNTAVDLKTEELDVTINTVPRKGLGISFSDLINPYTKISGTMANPNLALDPEGVMIEGGAAIATGGISILAKSFKDRFLSAKDPCGKATEEADPGFQAIKNIYYPETAAAQ